IYSGVNVLDEKVFNKFTESLNGCSSNFDETLFTSRELEIIKLVADGLSNKDIAANLFISEGTVKNHVSTILEKGGLSHRTQLAVYYLTGKK
ncbi:response regulator transcription factor, partial [Inconstantimicrobium porci]|uniref:response regulator transcription factor n=1 Tax=Inconstantimicrobium porci TaxID=2652291 RepID=UPI00240A2699